jgi:hypothetical protein
MIARRLIYGRCIFSMNIEGKKGKNEFGSPAIVEYYLEWRMYYMSWRLQTRIYRADIQGVDISCHF